MQRDLELQIEALVKENKALKEQLLKIKTMANYYETETKEWLECENIDDKQLKFQLFKQYIDSLSRPKNIFELLMRNFYQYLIQHFELDKLQKTINRLIKR